MAQGALSTDPSKLTQADRNPAVGSARPRPASRFALARTRRRFVVALLWGATALLALIALFSAQEFSKKVALERLSSQAQIIRLAMSGLLDSGLPLSDFVGFDHLAQSLMSADHSLVKIRVLTLDGQVLLEANQQEVLQKLIAQTTGEEIWPSATDRETVKAEFGLGGRFGQVATIELERQSPRLMAHLDVSFWLLILNLLITLVIASIYFLAISDDRLFFTRNLGRSWLISMSFSCLLLLSGAGLLGMAIYGEKANGFSDVIGARLREAVDLGLEPERLSGLGEMIAKFQEDNPDIGRISIILGNYIYADTRADQVGQRWESSDGSLISQYWARPRNLIQSQLWIATSLAPETVALRIANTNKFTLLASLLFLLLPSAACYFLLGRKGHNRA
ncbi:hypothetical protein ACTL6U_10700 [Rhodovibrionaceae bacterium A322]